MQGGGGGGSSSGAAGSSVVRKTSLQSMPSALGGSSSRVSAGFKVAFDDAAAALPPPPRQQQRTPWAAAAAAAAAGAAAAAPAPPAVGDRGGSSRRTSGVGGRRGVGEWRDAVLVEKEDDERRVRGLVRPTRDFVRWGDASPHAEDGTLPTEGQRLRWTGNARFAENNFAQSAGRYTQGVKEAELSEKDAHLKHIFYTNRASALLPLKNYSLALSDAQKAIDHRPAHVLAHIRKALALLGLNRPADATDAIYACARISADAEAQRKASMATPEQLFAASAAAGGGGGGVGAAAAARDLGLGAVPPSALSERCQQFQPAQRTREAGLKEEERQYLCCLLHKACPLPGTIPAAVEMLFDTRLQLVDTYAAACFHSLLWMLVEDDVDPYLPLSTLKQVCERKQRTNRDTFMECFYAEAEEGWPEEESLQAKGRGGRRGSGDSDNGGGVTKRRLEGLTCHGVDLGHEGETASVGLSTTSEGKGRSSLTGRLLVFVRANGCSVLECWKKTVTALRRAGAEAAGSGGTHEAHSALSKHMLAIDVNLTAIHNLLRAFLPYTEVLHHFRKLDALYLTEAELREKKVRAAVAQKAAGGGDGPRRRWAAGDYAELRLVQRRTNYFQVHGAGGGGEDAEGEREVWLPCKVLKAMQDGSVHVHADGSEHVVLDPALLRPPPVLHGLGAAAAAAASGGGGFVTVPSGGRHGGTEGGGGVGVTHETIAAGAAPQHVAFFSQTAKVPFETGDVVEVAGVREEEEQEATTCNVLRAHRSPEGEWVVDVVEADGTVHTVAAGAVAARSTEEEKESEEGHGAATGAGTADDGVVRWDKRAWSPGEYAEVLLSDGRWAPCKVLRVRLDGGVEVSVDGASRQATVPELRPPSFPSSLYYEAAAATETAAARDLLTYAERRRRFRAGDYLGVRWRRGDVAEVLVEGSGAEHRRGGGSSASASASPQLRWCPCRVVSDAPRTVTVVRAPVAAAAAAEASSSSSPPPSTAAGGVEEAAASPRDAAAETAEGEEVEETEVIDVELLVREEEGPGWRQAAAGGPGSGSLTVGLRRVRVPPYNSANNAVECGARGRAADVARERMNAFVARTNAGGALVAGGGGDAAASPGGGVGGDDDDGMMEGDAYSSDEEEMVERHGVDPFSRAGFASSPGAGADNPLHSANTFAGCYDGVCGFFAERPRRSGRRGGRRRRAAAAGKGGEVAQLLATTTVASEAGEEGGGAVREYEEDEEDYDDDGASSSSSSSSDLSLTSDLPRVSNFTAYVRRVEQTDFAQGRVAQGRRDRVLDTLRTRRRRRRQSLVNGDSASGTGGAPLDAARWRRCEGQDGKSFYFNKETGQVVRNLADAERASDASRSNLRAGDSAAGGLSAEAMLDPATAAAAASAREGVRIFMDQDVEDEMERDPSVILALQTGEWVIVRNLRTGHRHYYCPATKGVVTDLKAELARSKAEANPKANKPPLTYDFVVLDEQDRADVAERYRRAEAGGGGCDEEAEDDDDTEATDEAPLVTGVAALADFAARPQASADGAATAATAATTTTTNLSAAAEARGGSVFNPPPPPQHQLHHLAVGALSGSRVSLSTEPTSSVSTPQVSPSELRSDAAELRAERGVVIEWASETGDEESVAAAVAAVPSLGGGGGGGRAEEDGEEEEEVVVQGRVAGVGSTTSTALAEAAEDARVLEALREEQADAMRRGDLAAIGLVSSRIDDHLSRQSSRRSKVVSDMLSSCEGGVAEHLRSMPSVRRAAERSGGGGDDDSVVDLDATRYIGRSGSGSGTDYAYDGYDNDNASDAAADLVATPTVPLRVGGGRGGGGGGGTDAAPGGAAPALSPFLRSLGGGSAAAAAAAAADDKPEDNGGTPAAADAVAEPQPAPAPSFPPVASLPTAAAARPPPANPPSAVDAAIAAAAAEAGGAGRRRQRKLSFSSGLSRENSKLSIESLLSQAHGLARTGSQRRAAELPAATALMQGVPRTASLRSIDDIRSGAKETTAIIEKATPASSGLANPSSKPVSQLSNRSLQA